MMNWILLVMAAIAAVVVAMLVGGLLAPRVRVSSRTLTTDAPAGEVYRLLREADGPPRWCPELPTMRVHAEQAPRNIEFALHDDDGAPLGSWRITVDDTTGRTVATLTQTVTVSNPLVRFLRSFGDNGARPQRFLEAAASELGHKATVHS